MINRLNRQNDSTISDITTETPQRIPRFSGILGWIFPCRSNRLILESVITNQADMHNPANTTHLNSVSSITTDRQSENYLLNTLENWKNSSADNDEYIVREFAAARILNCVNDQNHSLDLSALQLTSLPENIFQYTPFLRHLDCSFNRLKTLNLRDCPELIQLKCYFNQLESLQLNNVRLQKLDCSGNQLNTLNLSHCPNLIEIDTSENPLESLQISHCPQIKVLDCSSNHLASIDLRHCPQLVYLGLCDNNPLVDLSLPQINPAMQNPLRHLGLTNTGIEWNNLPEAIRENQEINIDIRPNNAINQNLNNAHNTHIASIHRSASKNAAKLKNNNLNVNTDQAYENLSSWIFELSIEDAAIENGLANEAYKNKAAEEWIQNPLHLNYIDRASGVSIKEFLALAWIAMHDDTQRELNAPLHNAKESLRDALYEMRRGDNLGRDPNYPKDNGQAASNICASGTFNKVSEKLVSAVKDMSFQLITEETFTTSLQASIRREVVKLIENADHDRLQKKALDDNDGLLTQPMWDQIKEAVKIAIDEEFQSDNEIGGKSISQLFEENTHFENILAFLRVMPT